MKMLGEALRDMGVVIAAIVVVWCIEYVTHYVGYGAAANIVNGLAIAAMAIAIGHRIRT
jgi:hypothetical protein